MGRNDQERDDHGRWSDGGGGGGGRSGGESTKKDWARDSSKNIAATGTKYTVKELESAATTAGKKLFGEDLIEDGEGEDVLHANMSEMKQYKGDVDDFEQSAKDEERWGENEALVATVDDFEYQFFPSTGEGKDVSNEFVHRLKPDKDGNIYIGGASGIRVIHGKNDKPKVRKDWE